MIAGAHGSDVVQTQWVYESTGCVPMNRYRSLSRNSRTVFWIVLAVMIVAGLIAFFASETGRTIALVCCGLVVVLIVVGVISEGGMRRPR